MGREEGGAKGDRRGRMVENTAEAFQWSRERRVVGRNLLLSPVPYEATTQTSSACHCTLAYISLMGKSRVLQLRSGGGRRIGENCNGSSGSSNRDLSLSLSL